MAKRSRIHLVTGASAAGGRLLAILMLASCLAGPPDSTSLDEAIEPLGDVELTYATDPTHQYSLPHGGSPFEYGFWATMGEQCQRDGLPYRRVSYSVWHVGNGTCSAIGWASSDPADCRVNVWVRNSAGFLSGTCYLAVSKHLPENSCGGRCGGQAPAGCWCDTLCTGYGDCCSDYQGTCMAWIDLRVDDITRVGNNIQATISNQGLGGQLWSVSCKYGSASWDVTTPAWIGTGQSLVIPLGFFRGPGEYFCWAKSASQEFYQENNSLKRSLF